MMIPPPENSGDYSPGHELACPECCSVWWLALITLTPEKALAGYVDKARCVNCEFELNLEESTSNG